MLHAASQDLPSLREVDLEPPSIFDTELGRSPPRPRAGGARRRRRGHARHHPRQGALGGRLVDAAAAPVVARVRRAGRRASRGRARRPGRRARRAGEDRDRAPRSSDAVLERSPKPPRGGPLAPALRTAHRTRAPCASPSRARCGSRGRTTPASRTSPRAGSSPTGRSSRAVLADPPTKQRPRGDEGVQRPREPHPAGPLVGRDRGRPRRRPDLPLDRAPAATRCRRRAHGLIAIPRPTPGRRPPAPRSRRARRSWGCRRRTS